MASKKHQILMYHRVVPDNCPRALIDMLGGELVTQRIFQLQIAWLKKHYRLVDIKTLLANRSETQPMAAITFDDGFSDNLHYALPVMQQLAVPATLFMIFGSIGNTSGFLHHQLARFISGEGKQLTNSILKGHTKPRDQLQSALIHLEKYPDGDLAEAFNKINKDNHEDRFLSSRELQELNHADISIQSHTVSHTRLSSIKGEMLAKELSESKAGLEKLLEKEVNYLAYPLGRGSDFNALNMAAASTAGYTAAFTAIPGGIGSETNKWSIPRTGCRNSLSKLKRKLHPFFRKN